MSVVADPPAHHDGDTEQEGQLWDRPPGDANWAPRPLEPYVKSMRRSPGKLRVAVTASNPYDADVDEESESSEAGTFSGQGGQKGGKRQSGKEGTGYTEDRSGQIQDDATNPRTDPDDGV